MHSVLVWQDQFWITIHNMMHVGAGDSETNQVAATLVFPKILLLYDNLIYEQRKKTRINFKILIRFFLDK